VHPTVGTHEGALRPVSAAEYVDLLAAAGTRGFSVYLAETRMTAADWAAYAAAIGPTGIALAPPPS
jgi:hypothetical protein